MGTPLQSLSGFMDHGGPAWSGFFFDIAPAVLLGLVITLVTAGAKLLPLGEATMLVRLPDKTLDAAIAAAAAADAVFVTLPAPGYAVLRGNASRVRDMLGLAVAWKGAASCSIKP